MAGGVESWVKSTKPAESSVSGQDVPDVMEASEGKRVPWDRGDEGCRSAEVVLFIGREGGVGLRCARLRQS